MAVDGGSADWNLYYFYGGLFFVSFLITDDGLKKAGGEYTAIAPYGEKPDSVKSPAPHTDIDKAVSSYADALHYALDGRLLCQCESKFYIAHVHAKSGGVCIGQLYDWLFCAVLLLFYGYIYDKRASRKIIFRDVYQEAWTK